MTCGKDTIRQHTFEHRVFVLPHATDAFVIGLSFLIVIPVLTIKGTHRSSTKMLETSHLFERVYLAPVFRGTCINYNARNQSGMLSQCGKGVLY
jgi:hypothetical protein